MVREETGQGKDRFKISELFADERCSKATLDFLATTEVGRTAGPSVAGGEPGSEASEWEKREREEYLAQVAEEERALGEGAEDLGRGDCQFSFPSLFRFYFICQASKGGGRGRIVTGTFGGSVVAGKRFCNLLPWPNANDESKGGAHEPSSSTQAEREYD